VPHAEAGEAIVLYVVAADGAKGIVNTIRRRLPPQWICDSVNLFAALPKTAHGKLARSLLSRAAAGREQ
jgi:acyl-coenzyme A synthetase/AMP-(fatty) acid ligase